MPILVFASLIVVGFMFYVLNQHQGVIMATLAELNAKVDAVAEGVNSLEASIKALKEQVENGGLVSQADLDALMAKVTAIGDDISDPSDQ